MQVKEFVSETLKQVIEGVKDAQPRATELGGAVNPKGLRYLDGSSGAVQHQETTRIGQEIEFDIAVTVAETDEAKGGLGLMIATFGLGAQVKTSSAEQLVNRIKFRIPVIFPKSEYKEDE